MVRGISSGPVYACAKCRATATPAIIPRTPATDMMQLLRGIQAASRGAATECSPGARAGVIVRHDLSPVGAKESSESVAPTGLRSKTTPTPGLRPGLHSIAAPRLFPFRSLRKQTDASFSKRVRLMLGESEVIDGPSSPCLEGSNEKIRSSTGLRTCRHQPLPIPTGRCFPARFL